MGPLARHKPQSANQLFLALRKHDTQTPTTRGLSVRVYICRGCAAMRTERGLNRPLLAHRRAEQERTRLSWSAPASATAAEGRSLHRVDPLLLTPPLLLCPIESSCHRDRLLPANGQRGNAEVCRITCT